jgi:GNAT superfamily N-acetyltransferase
MKNKIKLFVDSFGDSEKTAKEFFSCDGIITVTEYVGNRLAAMASLIPICAQNASALERIRGYYIYGVCVDKEYRGKGLFFAIMKKAEEQAVKENADFVCLIPADSKLEATYRRWGYSIEILNVYGKESSDKNIFIEAPDFREFAIPSENAAGHQRMCGLMKVFNKKVFEPKDCEFAFGDFMGDI